MSADAQDEQAEDAILIAEDSRTQAEYLRLMLEEAGYASRIAGDGRKALEAIRRARPSLVISDIVMPGLDGFELCRTIKSDPGLGAIPVILLTSLAGVDDILKGLDAAADGFVCKPYEPRQLFAAVERALCRDPATPGGQPKRVAFVHEGGRYEVPGEPERVLDVLLGVYTQAIGLNRQLSQRQEQLSRANRAITWLDGLARSLSDCSTEQEIVACVAEQASQLHGAGAAWLALKDERDGSVFFRAGDLSSQSGLSTDEALRVYDQRGGRAGDPAKDDPFDAAIWQRSGEGEPAWESPWGPGRPGWHAECAAMATTLLGLSIDVHAGGADLAYPHHAYENAIVEAATGVTPFARSWMHVGTVTKGGEKVAKSTGNLVFVMDLLQRWAPQALRLHLLDRPWNASWDFDEADLPGAEAKLESLWSATGTPGGSEAAIDAACAALLEDLDVPRALGIALDEGGEAARTVAKVLALL